MGVECTFEEPQSASNQKTSTHFNQIREITNARYPLRLGAFSAALAILP